jgi:prophage antirepressor-like protein
MGAMMLRECAFEGAPLPVFEVEGRPHWIAKQVGAALGYEDNVFVGLVGREWKDEFVNGKDVRVLKGKDLRDFKEIAGAIGENPMTFTSALMLLTESGVTITSTLSRKPAGTRMRRWLADDVMPQIVRDGHFAPDRQVVDGQLTASVDALARVDVPKTRALADLRRAEASLVRANAMERNAVTRERAGLLRERQAKMRAHEHAARAQLTAGLISAVEFAACVRYASELVADGRIEMLSGNDPHGPWLRARDLSRKWKIPEQTIGKAAVALGLRGNIPGMVREVMGRRENSGGSAVTHEYSIKAQAEIKQHLDLLKSRQGSLPLT